ncbi:MAG: radical SAM protein [Planctomycetes bacterium]|nr:radical SAM protein [Planctomycetota bacterium]
MIRSPAEDLQASGHESTQSIIYGPVVSRRYGRSLGINPMPRTDKLCNFNCVYCQLGWTAPQQTGYAPDKSVFASPEEIASALRAVSRATLAEVDAIMICGNGEPTLHPRFSAMVDQLVAVRDTVAPRLPITLLTNGTRLSNPEIHAALSRLDQVAVKLDAGSLRKLKQIDMPREPVDLRVIAEATALLPRAVIQSCFVEGSVANTDEASIKDWLAALRFIRPERVDIYTISRTPPTDRVHGVSLATLEKIADRARPIPGLEVRVFGNGES